ncbi:MAG: queuosine precursor transporter [Proteobacteria bacterium]|nr:queuosine precursor transporter [Pseudomonadota bacterium]
MKPVASQPQYLDAITAVFITALLASNIVSAKTTALGGLTLGAGVFVFPLSYIFGDVLTEVYGYRRSRRVIWLGFGSAALAALIFVICDRLPPAGAFRHQAAFHTVLGPSPLVLAASLTAYACGEFCNSYVLAKLKIWSAGRHLWLRTIGSTIVGEAVDSAVFYPLAFLVLPLLVGMEEARWPWAQVQTVMLTNYVIKVLVEVVFTPATYRLVALLKRAEGLDVYDHDTNFSPFALER